MDSDTNADAEGIVVNDANSPNGKSRSATEQETENYIETYHAISEWIRFADAKAAVILTVSGALAGLLIPTVQRVVALDAGVWKTMCLVLFSLYILFFLLSGVYSFLCINPITKRGKHPSLEHCAHFHPAAVSAAYGDEEVERFVNDCEELEGRKLRREVQAAILIDSHVSSQKYRRVKKALIHIAISTFFGFVYFLLAQW